MPRGTKSRANARPDTHIGGRPVHTRGGITPERPGRSKSAQTADALASALGATTDIAEVYGKHQRVEDAKQQRLQAFKDFHKDANNDVSREEAQKRDAFSNDNYRKTYMRLSYSQQAKGLSSDIQQHAQEMMNDPDVGVDEVEQYIDATTSGAIQGINDPEAVDVFANRLTSDAEQLKKKARGIAVERQQTAGEAKLNGFIDDAVSEGINGPDFVNHALKMAGDLNVSQDSARAAVAQAVINKADQATDPSMLDVLDAKGDDGVALSDYPEIHDTVERARQKIEADVDQQTSAAELKQRYALRRKMDSGALTMSDIQRVNHDHPDWYTPDQLTSMLSRSQSKAQKVAAQRREAAAATAGHVSPVAMRMKTHSDQQAIFGHMREGIFGQHEDTPEGRQQAFMDYATRVAELSGGVAGVKDDWLAAQLNAGAEAPSPDGSMPDAFRAGYQRYKMLKHDPQTRGLLDNLLRPDARRMYQRVEDYAESGDYVGNEDGTRDLTPAYAKAKHDLANPIDEDTFYSSESFGKLQDTVNSITDVSSFLDLSEDYGGETGTVSNALEVKQDIRKMAEREMRYSRASLDQALKTARHRYKATHTLVRGTYIQGNYGDDATEAVNAKLAEELPDIRDASGDSVNMDDLTLLGDGKGKVMVFIGDNRPALVSNGHGGRRPLVFDMAAANEAYAEKLRPKGPTSERVDVDKEKPAPPPQPGSPATLADQMDRSNQEARESVRHGLSDAWQSVVDKLTEERKPQQAGGNPGKRY